MLRNKFIYMAIAFGFLIGCSSSPKIATPSVASDARYAINDVTFNLTQKRSVENYPTQEQLSAKVSDEIISALTEKDLLATGTEKDAVPISIAINYQRRFAGEDTPFPSNSVASPIVSYSIVLYENGVEKNRVTKSGLTTSKGFFGNLKTVATMGVGNDAKTEAADIQKLVNTIVVELQTLRR